MNTSNISYCNMFIFALTHRHGTVTVLLNFINDLFPWYSGHGTYKLSIDDLCIFPFSTTQQHFYVFFFLLRRAAIWPFCMQSVFELKLQKFSIRFYRFENVRLQPWTQKVKTQNDIFLFSVHKNVILNNHKKNNPSEIFQLIKIEDPSKNLLVLTHIKRSRRVQCMHWTKPFISNS